MKNKFIWCSFILLILLCDNSLAVPRRYPKRSKGISKQDSINQALDFLKIYYYNKEGWKLANPDMKPTLKGLLSYIETPPRDTIVSRVDSILQIDTLQFFSRDPETVENFQDVPGFINTLELQNILIARDREVRDSLRDYHFPTPDSLYAGIDSLPALISEGDEQKIKAIPQFKIPDYLYLNKKDSMRFENNPNFWIRHDSLYDAFMEAERDKHNTSIKQHFQDSVWKVHQANQLNIYSDSVLNSLRVAVDSLNKKSVIAYNDSVVEWVNDSLLHVVRLLNQYAENDSTLITLRNANNTSTQLWLKNNEIQRTRLHVQNTQLDSVNVIIENNDSRSLQLLIDDAVVFNRFREKERINAQKLTGLSGPSLQKIKDIKIKYSPWKLGVNSSIGFTQTHLSEYWAKGGNSSLSTLSEVRGYANYSKAKTKWDSYIRLKHGLVSQILDKEDGGRKMNLRKNSDLFEISSRFGKSAFKKWYYSTELNFRTQMFNGYKYPNDSVPISAFMAPGYLTFAIGLDYKPHKNLSLFLSPITSRTTFVCDTAKVDKKKYGLDDDDGTYKWEPGFIAKFNYKRKLMDQVNWDTKASLFSNYTRPFKKINFNWESNITFKINQYINARIATQLIYDYNVKFTTDKINDAGEKIKEPKWQFKELLVLGFSYTIKY